MRAVKTKTIKSKYLQKLLETNCYKYKIKVLPAPSVIYKNDNVNERWVQVIYYKD